MNFLGCGNYFFDCLLEKRESGYENQNRLEISVLGRKRRKSEEKIEVPEEKEENDLQKEKEEQKFLKEQKESLPPEKTNRSLPENNVQEQAEKRECRQEKTESGIDKEEEEKENFTADRRKAGGRKKKPLWDRMKEKISEWIESCKSFWRKILAIGRNLRGKGTNRKLSHRCFSSQGILQSEAGSAKVSWTCLSERC